MPTTSPLREARAQAVADDLAYQGVITLNDETFIHFRTSGMSRAEVNQGVNSLVTSGRARLETRGGLVTLYSVKPKDDAP
jgi:hypothetical protein